jgi:hypothetical protein
MHPDFNLQLRPSELEVFFGFGIGLPAWPDARRLPYTQSIPCVID